MARAYVGISGWRYASWRGDWYPKGLVQRRELEYAAARLDSVELNGTFYSLQRPSSFARWRDETPGDFVFAVKGGRYLTHMLRMRNVEQALERFFAQGVLDLGPKLGPVLWQLPARQRFEPEVLAAFFDALPRAHDGRAIRYALEVRNASFADARAIELLRERNIALVVADTAGVFPDLRAETADFAYIRLHGGEELYTSGYDDASLDRWAATAREQLDAGRDTYVYFDNDARGRAPWDAEALRARLCPPALPRL